MKPPDTKSHDMEVVLRHAEYRLLSMGINPSARPVQWEKTVAWVKDWQSRRTVTVRQVMAHYLDELIVSLCCKAF